MKSVLLPEKTLNWLLEDNNPPLRNLTKNHILNDPLSKREIDQINEYPPIRNLISFIKPDGTWGNPKNPYKKYTGDYWQLVFLSDLNANVNKLIRKASLKILSYQLPDGGFTHKIGSKFPLVCLTANIIRSLIHFEIEDERIQKGINFLTDHIIDNQGVMCSPDPLYTLLPDCQMALTKVLAMYATLNSKQYSSKIVQAIAILENKIVENRIFKYIPSGAKDFHKSIRRKKTSEIRTIRKNLLLQPEKLEKTEIKQSWTRFGFPQSYTSDILETLYWLSTSKISYHIEFDEAIDLVINSMNPSGYWINQNNFRNPMLVEIEPKKDPSKWLTFRACFVLKSYCELNFQD
ncbi:MAG: hypothetical protein ACXAB2_01775 [Candidatus Hodarchaeales archaeon]|jgi:hypothetical protein